MADQREGGIAWTEQTWNPVRGCTRISKGCTRCYAEVVAARFSDPGLAYDGLAKRTTKGPRWTGKLVVVDEHMADPIRWQRPRMIFVNSMSDLFHESLSIDTIARVYAVMLLAPHHTYQVLTKRAKRMREVLTDETFYGRVLDAAREFRDRWPKLTGIGISDPTKFPARHIWNGVSVEDQPAADERLPELVRTPSAVRWLSIEPQIGPVELFPWSGLFQWAVIGGESGHDARPFDLAWARSLISECRGGGAAVFVKQLGAVPVVDEAEWRLKSGLDGRGPLWLLSAHNRGRELPGTVPIELADAKGGDMAEWPADLRIREFPRKETAL